MDKPSKKQFDKNKNANNMNEQDCTSGITDSGASSGKSSNSNKNKNQRGS